MLFTGLRYLLLPMLVISVVGAVGWLVAWPTLASTIGPTAYVFVAHPESEAARLKNSVAGHVVAVGAGLAALAAFGLWNQPPLAMTGSPSPAEIGACAAAVGVTLAVLEVLHLHHAPAAATAILIGTGLAKPGAPLIGLVLGLGIVIIIGPFLGRVRAPGRSPSEIEAEASK